VSVRMTGGKPEPTPVKRTPVKRVTAAMDDFMATVLRHLRTGQGSPLEELGLEKAREELHYCRPDVAGAGTEPGKRDRAPAHRARALYDRLGSEPGPPTLYQTGESDEDTARRRRERGAMVAAI
jgi:hypothetical protein